MNYKSNHSYLLEMVWDSYNAFNSLFVCWILSNFSYCSSGSKVLDASTLSDWIFMPNSSNPWLCLEKIPIQSLTSLNIFVHLGVCLCKVSLALFPSKTIFPIVSRRFLLSHSCASILSSLSTSSDQAT
jgi:hypothetical protein